LETQKENALATKSEIAIPQSHNINGALDRLGSSVEYYKILHDGADAGKISGRDELRERIEFAWLATSFSRILRPGIRETDQRPICRARDGNSPDSGTFQNAGPCDTCPESQWNNSTAPATPPRCTEQWALFCWDLEMDAPFIFVVKRTGIKPLKRLSSRLRLGRGRYSYQGLSAFSSVKIELTAKKIEPPRGKTYYVPNFAIIEKLPETIARQFADCSGFVETANKTEIDDNEEDERSDNPPSTLFPKPQNLTIPDITMKDWAKARVGFTKAGDLTWEELAMGATLPDGRKGTHYLRQLAAWKDHPEVAEIANAALSLFAISETKQEKTTETEDEPPF